MLMELEKVQVAKKKLQDILQRAKKLGIPTRKILTTRSARKYLAGTTEYSNNLVWFLLIGIFFFTLGGFFYVHWSQQEVETIKTVLRKSCGTETGEFSTRVSALLYTSTIQDDC